MPCPKCDSENIDPVDEDFKDPNHHVEKYQCLDCGCVYQWESTRTIEEEGKDDEEEFNKILNKIKADRDRQISEQEALEEEEDMEDGG